MPFDFFFFPAAISILDCNFHIGLNKFSAEEISSQYSSATARATAVAVLQSQLRVCQ